MIIGIIIFAIVSVTAAIGCFVLGARLGFQMGRSGQWVDKRELKKYQPPAWLKDNEPKGDVHISRPKPPSDVRRDREAIKNNIPSFVRRKGDPL